MREELGPDEEQHGAPFYLVPVKKTARLPERPHISRIRKWFKKRKHAIMWRNRDSSYVAIATFYSKEGATRAAWDQLANAADRIPGPAIVFIRYELPIELLKKVKAPNGRYKVKTPFISVDKKGIHWTIDTTPGSRVRVPGDSDYNPNALVKHWEWLLSVIPDDRRETRCGLVVMWAPKGGWKGKGNE